MLLEYLTLIQTKAASYFKLTYTGITITLEQEWIKNGNNDMQFCTVKHKGNQNQFIYR